MVVVKMLSGAARISQTSISAHRFSDLLRNQQQAFTKIVGANVVPRYSHLVDLVECTVIADGHPPRPPPTKRR